MMSFIKVKKRRCRILVVMLLIVTLMLGVTISSALADSDKRVVKVMTQNMDAGTDLLFFFVTDPITATQLTYNELLDADFSVRAGLLADQIVIQQPYLISLQEVTLWQTISATGETATLADQLDLLMDALAARHRQYEVVASQDLTDIAGPLGDGSYLRFLDRNVILTRTDIKRSELALSNVRSGIYQATIAPVPDFPEELNGWLSVDAKIRGKSLRFFCTHLETPVFPEDDTQVQQGLELIAIMGQSKLPVILAGDFNSDASGLGIILHRTDASLLLCYVGHHDEAYRWAERRKLEVHPKTGAAQLVEIRERVQEFIVPKYVEAKQPVQAKPALFAGVSDVALLGYGVPEEWLDDV